MMGLEELTTEDTLYILYIYGTHFERFDFKQEEN